MTKTRNIFNAGKKWIAIMALSFLTIGAFATLGEGNKRSSSPGNGLGLLSSRSLVKPGSFSLRSGYDFRGAKVINTEKKYFSLTTTINVQKGNTTYVLPLKKNVLISNIKIDLGNRQFRK
jgi:hypothetical protein